jgi:hypothetical protein
MSTNLVEQLDKIIIENELSGNLAFVHKFSDPDGVRSGKSGWSFGRVQWDVQNNPAAARCLAECGFTAAEIAGIKGQSIDVHQFEPRLKAHADIVKKWDDLQLESCLRRAQNILAKHGVTPADDTALLAVADYDNQYHLSDINKPGYLVHYLAGSGLFTAKDVLQFKLDHTKYGEDHPDDCRRRYNNLIKIMKETV